MKIYKDGSEQLHELIRLASADAGATLLVPDLQRPYVWSPNQVILLVDSLLRGWPFGTLLLWTVRHEELASIPSRPFWRVADRTGAADDQQVGPGNPPAEFRMVLDGQQRLQSLLLAFAGDPWGFRLLDHEWSTVLEAERPRGKNAKSHWSLGHLCLDLYAFRDAIHRVNELEHVDFREVLAWVIQRPNHGTSQYKRSKNYKSPIPSAFAVENKGRFVRLSRLWDEAPPNTKLSERLFRQRLSTLMDAHSVNAQLQQDVLDALAELMTKLVDIKQASVSFLQLAPFDPDSGTSQEAYNDAIVNIFTRLNTAGRALTRQEITFAWIKNGWGDGAKTDGKTAGQCFDDLKDLLKKTGVAIEIDDLVGAVSAMWAVTRRNGQLLSANDLLRGAQVRPMAEDLVDSWGTISANILEGAALVVERGFQYNVHYRSLNVLTLLLTWRLLGRRWLETHKLDVPSKDAFEKALNQAFQTFGDRWIMMSQWSGRWGKSTDKVFAEYAKDLAADCAAISGAATAKEVLDILTARAQSWLDALLPESTKYIENLAVLTRGRVHEYYLPLWLWHRLDAQRWNASAISLRESKRGALALEVDHVVSVNLWGRLAGAQILEVEDGEELGELGAETEDASTKMNALGNCCLLEKSFNIAKGTKPLKQFLDRVHEFTTGAFDIKDWSQTIGLDAELVDPSAASAKKISTLVDDRTAAMKEELIEYLQGNRTRADI